MPERPLIGIAGDSLRLPSGRVRIGAYGTYVDAVEAAGGIPLLMNPNPRDVLRHLQIIDGVLLTGGDDIHPKHFGQRRRTRAGLISPDVRTLFEFGLVHGAICRQKPILGICLGCQTLNVALGGSLVQDLPKNRSGRVHRKGLHTIRVVPRTRLFGIAGASRTLVKSRHHQSLDRVAAPLTVSACSSDGVAEAVELPGRSFVLGVQWHPEEQTRSLLTQRLFRAFVRAARRG